MIKFTTRVSWVEFCQLAIDGAPCFNFFGSVFHSRDRLSAKNKKKKGKHKSKSEIMSALEMETFILFVMKCDVCKFLATCTVNGISKSRMIGVKFGAVRQNLISKSIQVLNSSGKPRNRPFCDIKISKSLFMFQIIVFCFRFFVSCFRNLKK